MKVAILLNCPTKITEIKEDKIIYTDGAYRFSNYYKDKTTLAVVGDFDTLKYIPKNENVILLNCEKDFTDGERAIYYAKEIGVDEISIYGALGGKIDHILGNITLLKVANNLGLNAKIIDKKTTILLCSDKFCNKLDVGDKISLIPYTDKVIVTNSSGLKYKLDNTILEKTNTLGISNEVIEKEVSFTIENGEVLVIITKK